MNNSLRIHYFFIPRKVATTVHSTAKIVLIFLIRIMRKSEKDTFLALANHDAIIVAQDNERIARAKQLADQITE